MPAFFSNKTILVTGASGFIGSHLTARLLEAGAKVIGVDNFITGRRQNLSAVTDNPNFTFIEADAIQDPAVYLSANTKIEVIYHLASPASPPRYQAKPIETYLVNSLGTHHLLTHLYRTNPKARFILASTSEVYGDPAVHPQPETYWGNVNPNGPRSCYDESKRLGETIAGVFERDFTIDVRIARIFNTYGPHMDPDDGRIIPNFVKQALSGQSLTIYGDGKQTRSYCYVDDLVEGLLRLGDTPDLKGQTINLGNPGEYTVKETAETIMKIIPSAKGLEYRALPTDDPKQRRPDITKAKALLGWEPTVPFPQGLEKTIAYFKSVVN